MKNIKIIRNGIAVIEKLSNGKYRFLVYYADIINKELVLRKTSNYIGDLHKTKKACIQELETMFN